MAPPLIDTSIVPEVPGALYALFDYGLTKELAKKAYNDYIKSPLNKGYTSMKNVVKQLGNLKTPFGYQVATPLGTMKVQKTVNETVQDMKESVVQMAKKLDEAIGGKGTVKDYLDDIVVAGNVNAGKMNKLKIAIQNNTFSVDELFEISKKMDDLGIAKEYHAALIKIDFGKYLRGILGEPPVAMVDPHAHHILFKKGLGKKQQELVQEGQEILKKYGIDPIIGEENLVWAPNRIAGQHGIERLEHIVDKLKEVDGFGGTREKMVEMLELLGEEAALMK